MKKEIQAWRNFPSQTFKQFESDLEKIQGSKRQIITNILKDNIHEDVYLSQVDSFETLHSRNKKVCLMGEAHEERNCKGKRQHEPVSPERLIEHTILSNPDKLIDVFLEISYITKDEKRPRAETRSGIDTIEEKFRKCLTFKKKCYPNARFHYSDVRNKMTTTFQKLNRLLYDGNPTVSEIKNVLKIYTFDTFVSNFKKTKVLKQIKNVSDIKIRKFLESEVQDMLNKVQDLLNNPSFTEKFILDLHGQDARIVDLYILGRMFRDFKTLKDRPLDSPKYIFVYAGETHVYSISSILGKLGFESDFLVEDLDESEYCLNISESLPIF